MTCGLWVRVVCGLRVSELIGVLLLVSRCVVVVGECMGVGFRACGYLGTTVLIQSVVFI